MGAMHTPFEPRDVGEVRQLLRRREAGEERGEALAVLVQIAARRRMTSSILAREPIEELLADDFRNHRKSVGERLRTVGMQIAAIDRETPQRRLWRPRELRQ